MPEQPTRVTLVILEEVQHRLVVEIEPGEDPYDLDPDDPRITDQIGDRTVTAARERRIYGVEEPTPDDTRRMGLLPPGAALDQLHAFLWTDGPDGDWPSGADVCDYLNAVLTETGRGRPDGEEYLHAGASLLRGTVYDLAPLDSDPTDDA